MAHPSFCGSYDKESLYEIKTSSIMMRLNTANMVHMTKNLSTRLKPPRFSQFIADDPSSYDKESLYEIKTSFIRRDYHTDVVHMTKNLSTRLKPSIVSWHILLSAVHMTKNLSTRLKHYRGSSQ